MIMRKILVLNGPNLDMLGVREPGVYGNDTLDDLEDEVTGYAGLRGIEVTCYQSNSESKLIGKIHGAQGKYDGIVYNPGAHTHYSYALRDAVGSIEIPVVEVHLSDIDDREEFRRVSVIAPACVAQVKGLGVGSYCRAIDVLWKGQSFARLGEGFERRFERGQNVIVATDAARVDRETNGQDEVDTATGAAADAADATGYALDVVDALEAADEGGAFDEAGMHVVDASATTRLADERDGDEGDAAWETGGDAGGDYAKVGEGTGGGIEGDGVGDAASERIGKKAIIGEIGMAHAGAVGAVGAIGAASAIRAASADASAPELSTDASEHAQHSKAPFDDSPRAVLDAFANALSSPESSNDRVDMLERGPETPIDYTAPYHQEISSIDAGLLSYERQALVRSACKRIGIDSLLVRDTSNIRWITVFDGVFDEERAHGLLLSEDRACLHTDSRYAHAVRLAATRTGSDIVVNEDRVNHAQFAYDMMTRSGGGAYVSRLGIEDTITYAEFVKMVEAFQTNGLAPTTDVVLGLRAVKDAGEIVRLKAAQAVTDAAFSHIIRFMRPGMTEKEVQLELEDFMMRHGGEALAFRSIVAAGPNGADPHAVPGSTRLEAGQCVVMDFGAKAYGYCSDMTRTVFIGQPDDEMARAWETLRRANEAVESFLKPGVTGVAAHRLAEQVLERGGFGGKMGHGLGHGVGLDVHELPVLNPRNGLQLVEGNVVTVEPGIYLPGKFGMRLEDFGVITSSGFDVFTQSTHEMVII